MSVKKDLEKPVRVLAVTGSPGAGKSTLSKTLAQMCEGYVIDVKALVDEGVVPAVDDATRATKVVDVGRLEEHVKQVLGQHPGRLAIIDSHLSHRLSVVDAVIVLRCPPTTLLDRYTERGYSPDKKAENLEAEYLGVIREEAVSSGKPVFEAICGQQDLGELGDWLQAPKTRLCDIDYTEDFTQLIVRGELQPRQTL